MGNLLRLLARDEGTCFSTQRYDLFLDFESKFIAVYQMCDSNYCVYNVSLVDADAQPTDSEKEVFSEVDAVLSKGRNILKEISQYRGASKEIREV